ncbi:hypothetical protein JY97_00700 [Alkalispirochaeta odontotermitis]|nr:hypothetical protein JY97_00700 [Alkalispirochaeta odontotermitis]
MAKGGGKQETVGGGFSFDKPAPTQAPKVDPKEFGKTVLGDLGELHNQGPRTFDKALYSGMGQGAQNSLQSMLTQAGQPVEGFGKAMNFATGAIDSAGQPGMAETALGDLARGDMLGQNNQYRNQILDDTRADVEASLGASGRFGTTAHAETLADRLGGLRGSFYDQDRAQQMNAINMINGEQGQQFGQGMAASAALPALYQNQFAPGQTALSLNQMLDADKQAELMADYDLFKRQDPSNHIQNTIGLMQMMQGQPGTQEEKNTFFGDLVGGGIGLASMFL